MVSFGIQSDIIDQGTPEMSWEIQISRIVEYVDGDLPHASKEGLCIRSNHSYCPPLQHYAFFAKTHSVIYTVSVSNALAISLMRIVSYDEWRSQLSSGLDTVSNNCNA